MTGQHSPEAMFGINHSWDKKILDIEIPQGSMRLGDSRLAKKITNL